MSSCPLPHPLHGDSSFVLLLKFIPVSLQGSDERATCGEFGPPYMPRANHLNASFLVVVP